MATQSAPSRRAGTGVAGAGTGTLTVAIANALPAHSVVHTVLLYATPTISVAAGALVILLNSQVGHYQRLFAYKRAKKTLKATLKDPDTSEARKAHIQGELDSLATKWAASETSAAIKIFRTAKQ